MITFLMRVIRLPRRIARSIRNALRASLHRLGNRLMPMLAPAVAVMARTGLGTDAALRMGALPLPVHFYSPVPDLDDMRKRQIWSRRSKLSGIEFQPEHQIDFLRRLGADFGAECQWPVKSTDPAQFHTDNSGFSYSCAAPLHTIIRSLKPKRIIEVGSGNSTRVIAAAMRANARDGSPGTYTVIDPYPDEKTKAIEGITNFLVERVELVDVAEFEKLGENDILFIDSGHTVRIGGDVNFLFLDVLPLLKPGVHVHIHDIPMPYEYSEVYFTNPSFRMLWTESYLLQAFLCLNPYYETTLAMSWIMTERRADFAAAFPHYDPTVHVNSSSSYWIRRVR